VQIWSNAQQDTANAVARYRKALSYGGTRPLTELFQIAGAKLAFDSDTLGKAVEVIERAINELEA
jgi:oligoendopeptidase F